ncbi:MAG: hypothetical protein PVJ31_03355 [Methyloceanibacter sp.]
MNAPTASLINAIVLLVFSIWAYLSSESPSITALIPAAIGALLLACYPGVKNENKVVAHIAVVLTALALIGLFTPLRGALERDDGAAIFRVGAMMATTAIALAYFVKSFFDARRRKA